MRTPIQAPLAALALFLFALSGCLGGGGDGGDGGGAGGGGGACTADADCNDNTMKCSSGECKSKCAGIICNADQECEATTGSCIAKVVSCTADTDCTATQKCASEVCVEKCDGVICDTSIGETCETTTGLCIGGGESCTVAGDCSSADDACGTDGKCGGGTFASCNTDDPCAEGFSCETSQQGSLCIKSCTADTECPADQKCGGDGLCTFNICRPNAPVACTADTDCDTGAGQKCLDTTPAGGDGSYCLDACTQNSDCEVQCITGSGTALDNFCVPVLSQQAEYWGTCDAHGTGDGRCLGPIDLQVNPSTPVHGGFCTVKRKIANGGTGCDTSMAPALFGGGKTSPGDGSKLCDGYCADTQQGPICLGYCEPGDGLTCPSLFGQVTTACVPSFGFSGICLPTEYVDQTTGFKPVVAADQTCDPAAQTSTSGPAAVCVDDYYCAELTAGGGTYQCMTACETQAGTGERGECATGACEGLSQQGNPFLGVCR